MTDNGWNTALPTAAPGNAEGIIDVKIQRLFLSGAIFRETCAFTGTKMAVPVRFFRKYLQETGLY